MSRSSSRRFPWAELVGTLALGGTVIGLSPGCSGEAPLPAAGGFFGDGGPTGNPFAPPPGPCTDGTTRKCGVTLSVHDGIASCFKGVNECVGGHWSECRNGTEVQMSLPSGNSPGARSQSLSQATPCGTNPCDPRCQQWLEQPDGGVNIEYEGSFPVIPDGGVPYNWVQGSPANYPSGVGTKEPCTVAADCQIDSHCVSPSAGTCAHSQCATGAALASACNPCVTEICGADPTCCSGSWTQSCVDAVSSVCGATCTAGVNPGDPPLTDGKCEPWYPTQTDPSCAGYDLTVGPTCTSGIPVCNRGKSFSPAGVTVSIYPASQFESASPSGATSTCTVQYPIAPGWCRDAQGCATPNAGDAILVSAPASTEDGGSGGQECRSDDDWSIYAPGACTEPICSSNASSPTAKTLNLFFMVDRSWSMVCGQTCPYPDDPPTDGSASRWDSVTAALKDFLGDPKSAGIHVALRFFPDSNPVAGCDGASRTGVYNGTTVTEPLGDNIPPGTLASVQCPATTAPACDANACATPLVEGTLDWPVGTSPCASSPDKTECDAFNALATTQPIRSWCFNTPLYPALGGAIQWAEAGKSARPNEEFAVVIVTDSDPEGGCDNTPADIETLAANGLANGVTTYVVGISGATGVSASMCNGVASAGGGQCFQVSASNGDVSSQAAAAFQSIAAKTTSCDFSLPNTGAFDPSLASVTYTAGASPAGFAPACRPDETLNSANGHCYYTITESYPWATAESVCEGLGSGFHLVKIDDAAENTFVRGLTSTANVWIGGENKTTGASSTSPWTWWDGSTIPGTVSAAPYANWGSAPTGAAPNNCILMGSGGTWSAVDCATFSGIVSVCEGPKEGDPSVTQCPAGQTAGPDGKCYLVDTTTRTWDQALAHCQGLGMDLASITSSEQNTFVAKELDGSFPAWINLRNYSGTWKLGDGTTVYGSVATGCRSGETLFNGECYTVTSSATSWATARATCQSPSGNPFDLVRIDSDAENTFVKGLVGNTDSWTGAYHDTTVDTWRWIDSGSSFYDGRACLSDETLVNGVCYYVATASPTSWSGAESACAARGAKLVEIGSAAKNADVKGVLGAATSVWLGADDSASEGHWVWNSTKAEFWFGKGPAAPCPAGTKTGTTGTCYTNNGGGALKWDSAQTACRGLTAGGLSWDLTTISSDTENAWVTANFPPVVATWIGAYRLICGSACTTAAQRWSTPYVFWSDGSPWGYTHWGGGQPDTAGGCVYPPSTLETRAEIVPGGGWNDDCDDSYNLFPYVCEAYTPGPLGGLYNDWATTPAAQPAAAQSQNDCAAMATDGTWSDQDCGVNRAYVCERPNAAVGGAYTDWNTGEPTARAADANCGVISASTGQWSDESCTSGAHPGVCEGPELAGLGPAPGVYNNWATSNPTASQTYASIGSNALWNGAAADSGATYSSVCIGPPVTNNVPASLTPVSGSGACTSNGQFYFDDPTNPTKLTLCSKACSAVQADRHARVDVEIQCKPTNGIPLPPGYPKPLVTTYTQNYAPTCGMDQTPVWQFLAYNAKTPGDSTIDIDARVGTDAATLAAAPWKPLVTISAAANNQVCAMSDPCLVDVFSQLGAPDDNAPLLDLRMTLHPGSNGEAPEVIDWQLTHTCKDNQ